MSFRLEIFPLVVRVGTEWVLCCLIVGIHASGIPIPPVDVVRVKSYVNSLFMPIVPGRIAVFWNSG